MTEINWLEEVTKQQGPLLDDLFRLLKIESVRDDEQATEEAPVGPGPKKALDEFLAMAKEDDFKTEKFGPWAGRVEIGSGDELLGILGHVDVVPAGTGWNTDPFEPQIINNRIYARGSSDDKGPTVAAYFALKLLRDMGVEFNQRVHLIVGTDEESEWQCMDYYFDHAEMPDYGFSPDATFPIINGEKGNVSANFYFKAGQAVDSPYQLDTFHSGLRANMVPQDAKATVTSNKSEDLAKAFDKFVENNETLSGASTIEDDQVTLDLTGRAAHGSTPQKGVNAATWLATFLNEYTFDQVGAQDFVGLLTQELHEDFDGTKVGVAYEDDTMGAVTMNVGIANYTPAEGGFIDANFRYPKGLTPEAMEDAISDRLLQYTVDLTMTGGKEPHYVPADDPIVKTLLEVYENQTGEKGHEQVIGGGTYARLMPRGVAFGALFPDSTDTMHQANEFLAVDDLLKATAIYAEAIYRLTR